MGFFQNTRLPQGAGGKIMVKIMNVGHARVADWGFSEGRAHIFAPRDARVLDVGCGGGRNLSRWLDICPDGTVCGIDYSQTSVDESHRRNARSIARGRCEVLKGDVARLPFSDDSFDAVSAFETIYFWPDLLACFGEVRRVLRARGTFMICNESDGSDPADERWCGIIGGMRIYNERQIVDALRRAGFTGIETHRNPRRRWLCITAKS